METTVNMNPLRFGNFTSSEAVALYSTGKRDMAEDELAAYKITNPKSKARTIESWPGDACITYINETNVERILGRAITNESDARPLMYGKLCEPFFFQKLPNSYRLSSAEVMVHPTIDWWSGSPEGEKFGEEKRIGFEMKSPSTLSSFTRLVDPFYRGLRGMDAINAIRKDWIDPMTGLKRKAHKDGEKYFIQMISNAVLLDVDVFELIVSVPYKDDLTKLKVTSDDHEKKDGVARFFWAEDDSLPWIHRGGYYQDITIIRFDVPQEEKNKLTELMIAAGTYLKPRFVAQDSLASAEKEKSESKLLSADGKETVK